MKPGPTSTDSTPGHGTTEPGVGPSPSGGKAAESFEDLERRYNGAAPTAGDVPGGHECGASSGILELGVAGLAAGPFDLMALKTGHKLWELNSDEKGKLTRAAQRAAAKYGVNLDEAKMDPLVVLVLGYVGLAIPRAVDELRLIREELTKNNNA